MAQKETQRTARKQRYARNKVAVKEQMAEYYQNNSDNVTELLKEQAKTRGLTLEVSMRLIALQQNGEDA